MLEKKINEYGRAQIIHNYDYIIKIDDKFLQVRLIKTKKYRGDGFTAAMPRAKFVHPREDKFCYLVTKKDLLELKGKR